MSFICDYWSDLLQEVLKEFVFNDLRQDGEKFQQIAQILKSWSSLEILTRSRSQRLRSRLHHW